MSIASSTPIDSNPSSPATPYVTLGDVLASLPDIPPSRIRTFPVPGTATEADVVRIHGQEKRLCELFDGILVEKAMGAYESLLAMEIAMLVGGFVKTNDLGIVLGADGIIRLFPGQVRIPDIAFFSWAQFPNKAFPRDPVPSLHPDLAVEVLSEGNSRAEMRRKLHDYFSAGAKQVWYLDPRRREMSVYSSPTVSHIVTIDESLDGGVIVPGFQLAMADVFRIPMQPDAS